MSIYSELDYLYRGEVDIIRYLRAYPDIESKQRKLCLDALFVFTTRQFALEDMLVSL